MRDDLSPQEIIAAAMKRQNRRARRQRREETSLDAPDYRALMRHQDNLHKAKYSRAHH